MPLGAEREKHPWTDLGALRGSHMSFFPTFPHPSVLPSLSSFCPRCWDHSLNHGPLGGVCGRVLGLTVESPEIWESLNLEWLNAGMAKKRARQ